jgi:hypothetical protein
MLFTREECKDSFLLSLPVCRRPCTVEQVERSHWVGVDFRQVGWSRTGWWTGRGCYRCAASWPAAYCRRCCEPSAPSASTATLALGLLRRLAYGSASTAPLARRLTRLLASGSASRAPLARHSRATSPPARHLQRRSPSGSRAASPPARHLRRRSPAAHAPPRLRLGSYSDARPRAHAPPRLRLGICGALRHRRAALLRPPSPSARLVRGESSHPSPPL